MFQVSIGKITWILLLFQVVASHNHPTAQQIQQTRKIKVVGSSSDTNFDQDFHKFCFTIDVEDRNKKHAWFEAGQIMRKVQRFFKMNDIIPDETSLTVRKAETRLNRNRRLWTVTKIVCFLSEIQQQRFIEKSLRQFGIKHHRSMSGGTVATNQRQLAMKAFNNAKLTARNILDELGFKIKKASKVEILGHSIAQQQKLEEDLEDEFNEGQDSQEDRLSSGEEDADERGIVSEEMTNTDHINLKPIKIEVVFEVKPKDEETESTESDKQL